MPLLSKFHEPTVGIQVHLEHIHHLSYFLSKFHLEMEFAIELTCVDHLLCAMYCASYFINLSFNLNSPSIYFLLLMPFHK